MVYGGGLHGREEKSIDVGVAVGGGSISVGVSMGGGSVYSRLQWVR